MWHELGVAFYAIAVMSDGDKNKGSHSVFLLINLFQNGRLRGRTLVQDPKTNLPEWRVNLLSGLHQAVS